MVLYHVLQSNSRTFRNLASQSRQRRVYHPQLVAVYHQCEALYIIKPQGRYSPKGADEIQGRRAALDDIHDCVVMICQACGLVKQKENFCLPKVLFLLVETVEFESTTPCMSSMYSNQLSYASVTAYIISHLFLFFNSFFEKFRKRLKNFSFHIIIKGVNTFSGDLF